MKRASKTVSINFMLHFFRRGIKNPVSDGPTGFVNLLEDLLRLPLPIPRSYAWIQSAHMFVAAITILQ